MNHDTLRSLMAATGGRRFLLTVGAGIVDSLLLIGGYIHENTYEVLTLATVATYIGANTFQKTRTPASP